MSSQRELVQAMIRRRVSRAQKNKENLSVRDIILKFLDELNGSLQSTNLIVEKYWLIESKSQRLLRDLQRVDPEVGIELMWFGDEISQMRLEGVRILWSDLYKNTPSYEGVDIISLTDLLFD
jgi:hypothetical protein